MASKKKVGMVQPPPSKQSQTAGFVADLAAVLQHLNNDRSYTILATDHNRWIVLFEGDLKPSYVKLVDGKWKIVSS